MTPSPADLREGDEISNKRNPLWLFSLMKWCRVRSNVRRTSVVIWKGLRCGAPTQPGEMRGDKAVPAHVISRRAPWSCSAVTRLGRFKSVSGLERLVRFF
jgi:hypothetical protein